MRPRAYGVCALGPMVCATYGRTYGSQALVEELVQLEQVVCVVLEALHLLFLGQVGLVLRTGGREDARSSEQVICGSAKGMESHGMR